MKNGTHKKIIAQEPSPLHITVEQRAYEIWLSDGCRPGRDIENWLQAERELIDVQTLSSINLTSTKKGIKL